MSRRATLLIYALLPAACGQAHLQPASESRSFALAMQAELASGAGPATIWLPVPVSEEWQELGPLRPQAKGGEILERYDALGNRVISVSGTPPLAISYEVHVRRYQARPAASPSENGALPESSRWVEAARLAPTRPVHREALLATAREPTVLGKARILYDRVIDELALRDDADADRSVGRGELAWIRRAKAGNSIDFHALFIAYCQSIGIPAALEVGLALPRRRSADWRPLRRPYAWARFLVPGMGWQPVDAYHAKKHPTRRVFCFGGLTEDRVRLSVGRDLRLIPVPEGEPLNVFAAPYAERAGKNATGELSWSLRFRDLSP